MYFQRGRDVLLPQVFGLLQAEDENWRAYALGIINNFIWLDPPVLAQNMPTFLQALFALTTDSSAKVRKHVIQGINFLLDMRFNDLLPHINGVIEFVLHTSDRVLGLRTNSEDAFRLWVPTACF